MAVVFVDVLRTDLLVAPAVLIAMSISESARDFFALVAALNRLMMLLLSIRSGNEVVVNRDPDETVRVHGDRENECS